MLTIREVLQQVPQGPQNLEGEFPATDPALWTPDAGDTVVGILKEVVVKTDLRNYFPVAHIKQGETLRSVWIKDGQLLELWRQYLPRPGDHIALRYDGLFRHEQALIPFYSMAVLPAGARDEDSVDVHDIDVVNEEFDGFQ